MTSAAFEGRRSAHVRCGIARVMSRHVDRFARAIELAAGLCVPASAPDSMSIFM